MNQGKGRGARFVLVALVALLGLGFVGAFNPWSTPNYQLKTVHVGGANTVAAIPITTVNVAAISAAYRPLQQVSASWGFKHLSLYNSSTETNCYYALDSVGVADLTSTIARAGFLPPGVGKTFDFTASAFALRVATGAGSITVYSEETW